LLKIKDRILTNVILKYIKIYSIQNLQLFTSVYGFKAITEEGHKEIGLK
jgi:hypothetical protein